MAVDSSKSRLKSTLVTIGIALMFFTLLFAKHTVIILGLWTMGAGAGLSFIIFSNCKMLPNFFFINQSKIKRKPTIQSDYVKTKGCKICGNPKCGRHRPEVSRESLQPWEGVNIPTKVDKAVTEFLELLLQNYIYGWYRDLSIDETFVDELRVSIRFMVSMLVRRICKVNVPKLILGKCAKAGLQHLECYAKIRKQVADNADIEMVVLRSLGSSVHVGVLNRDTEIQYLRDLAKSLLPLLLPAKSLQCKSLCSLLKELFSSGVLIQATDKLSDPDFVNNMLLELLDEEAMSEPTEPPSPSVSILSEFTTSKTEYSPSKLGLTVYDVMHVPEALFSFMQFMKNEQSVNVLQFCLTVEDFNKRMLATDLDKDQEQSMLVEVREIYETYFAKDAVDKIMFDQDIVQEMQAALGSENEGIEQLKTGATLFRAYEHACNLLENTFIPLFHQSDDYFGMICGSRLPGKPLSRQVSRSSKKKFEPLAEFSKFANKLRGKLHPSKGEGMPFDVMEDNAFLEPESTEDDYLLDDVLEDVGQTETMINLSTCVITIPKITSLLEGGKQVFLYIISVQNREFPDSEESEWKICRKYNEFYVLHSKLKEFHGGLDDSMLPTKRNSMFAAKKPSEFYSSCRVPFEQYLQNIANDPVLRRSTLLHNFLTIQQEFSTLFQQDSVGNMAGRKIKSMLKKEKGQKLDTFLRSFLLSTECTAKKKSPIKMSGEKFEWSGDTTALSEISAKNSRLSSYGKHSPRQPERIFEFITDEEQAKDDDEIVHLNGCTEYFIYLARLLFDVSSWLLHVLVCAKLIGQKTLDSFLLWFLSYKMDLVTSEHNLVPIIHLLRDAIFFDEDPPRTDTQKIERRDETLEKMLNFLPEPAVHMLGVDKHNFGIKILFETLQHPKLNKQLVYVLLDALILELFPELDKKSQDG